MSFFIRRSNLILCHTQDHSESRQSDKALNKLFWGTALKQIALNNMLLLIYWTLRGPMDFMFTKFLIANAFAIPITYIVLESHFKMNDFERTYVWI